MKNLIINIILIFIFSSQFSNSIENKILFKVNNEIITSIDVFNEISYLKALNKKTENLDEKTIIEISKNSIIREKIKEIGIIKETENIIINDDFLNNALKNVYSNLNLNSIDEFENYLKKYDLNLEFVKNKLSIEIAWNELIVAKFRSRISIDKNKIINEVKKQDQMKINEFLLSEIFFNVENKSNINDKFNEIEKDIQSKGFDNAVLIHSKSNTVSNNGSIGWINENSLNKNIRSKISSLKIDQHTKPITIPGGFLILALKDKRIINKEINVNEEVEKLIRYRTNKQYNQFSNIYFKRIEKDIAINEL